jgi:transcriptional regulator with XRE-family HTH domain
MTDEEITRAVGLELRRARERAGLSRPALVKLLTRTRVPVNTYACYEQGLRPCSIPRLAEVCDALGVAPSDVIDRALRRTVRQHRIVGVVVVAGSGLSVLTPDEANQQGILARLPDAASFAAERGNPNMDR